MKNKVVLGSLLKKNKATIWGKLISNKFLIIYYMFCSSEKMKLINDIKVKSEKPLSIKLEA